MSLKYTNTLTIYLMLKKLNASPKVRRLFIDFIDLEDFSDKYLEISSDSTQKPQTNYIRASLLRLRRDELTKLIHAEDLHGLKLNKILFSNKRSVMLLT